MKKRVLFPVLLVMVGLLIVGCGSILNPQNVSVTTFSKASYIQLGATGSLTQISSSGVAALDVVIFAFGDIATTSIDSSYLTWMQTFMDYGAADAVCFLSIGGEYVTPEAINAAGGVNTIVSNVVAQISSYNSGLTTGEIAGVDLDLENGVEAATIEALAAGFKAAGLTVCIAPQVFVSSGQAVDPANPTNLVLTSGGSLTTTNSYGLAVASGNVDYIMVQAYNSGWITVNGYYENQTQFLKGIANALSNARTILSIPAATKVFVGTVANQCAGGQFNIFNPDLGWPFPVPYDHQAILNQLQTDIVAMENDSTNYGNINGIMYWSMNNDYMPTAWSDTYAVKGGFSKTICGATN
ncbi:MAG: hypothetical protein HQ564_00145 [Candidatus Saganbacteria bacterium]|nr:hypothetical protein [Candidatus Saganbacteria bacterium]